MNTPYLIQILEKPYDQPTFPVPKELESYFHHYGEKREISEESRMWLRNAIRGAYMGSAEFEFGSFQKALAGLAKSGPTPHEIEITGTRKKGGKVETTPKTTKVFLFCNPQFFPQVEAWLKTMATDDYGGPIRCKKLPKINEGLFQEKTQIIGWLDIDNYWLATTSQDLIFTFEALSKSPQK